MLFIDHIKTRLFGGFLYGTQYNAAMLLQLRSFFKK